MTTATLAELLEPCSAEDFLDESYGTSYRQVPGSPGKFSDLLSWARLNEILDAHPLDWLHAETDGPVVRNRLSLVRRGQAIAPASFFRDVPGPRGNPVRRVDPVRVAQLLRDGASLIVDGIDELHEPIGALAYRLERTLHEPVRVNLYASWTPTPSLERHWDTHDIFVLQVGGRKHWRVYAPAAPVSGRRRRGSRTGARGASRVGGHARGGRPPVPPAVGGGTPRPPSKDRASISRSASTSAPASTWWSGCEVELRDSETWQATASCPIVNGVAVGIAFQWQNVTPFGISSASDFLLDPPPALTSDKYAEPTTKS